jgi:ATP-dependent helicase HrpB
VLVFLPGQGEILRVARRLEESLDDPSVDIAPLYGAMDAADQDLAIVPSPAGRRKVVLATAIAQTSLTLEGVHVVIDSGLARVPRWDPAGGITRLATVRASRAAVDQRRGRAGRTGPGVCWRLWDEAETGSLPAFDRPEILETDLTRLALDLARWGAGEGADLALLDRPPAAAIAEARRVLREIGALDAAGRLTPHGAAVARLPLPPRLAHMVLAGAAAGQARRAALIGVLLTEQNLGGRDVDIAHRLDALIKDRSQRARAAVALADRLARMAEGTLGAPALRGPDDGLLVAQAWPARIAKARGAPGEYQLAGGRGAFLDPAEPLSREPWLAVADLGGGASRDRILLAARLEPASLATAMAGALVAEDRLVETPSGALRGQRILRLGVLTVEEGPLRDADPRLVEDALLAEVRRRGVAALPWDEAASALRARVAFLRAGDPRWPDISDEALAEHLDDWLAPLLKGRRSLRELPPGALREVLLGFVPWDLQRELDVRAPARWTAPTGSSFAIDYAAEGGPRVEVRVQELFGLTTHPTVGAGAALALALLSPAHREIQITRDLPRFWAGAWRDVRKDMRGRYPKHPWPEDPATAAPTTRTKPRA